MKNKEVLELSKTKSQAETVKILISSHQISPQKKASAAAYRKQLKNLRQRYQKLVKDSGRHGMTALNELSDLDFAYPQKLIKTTIPSATIQPPTLPSTIHITT